MMSTTEQQKEFTFNTQPFCKMKFPMFEKDSHGWNDGKRTKQYEHFIKRLNTWLVKYRIEYKEKANKNNRYSTWCEVEFYR